MIIKNLPDTPLFHIYHMEEGFFAVSPQGAEMTFMLHGHTVEEAAQKGHKVLEVCHLVNSMREQGRG